MADKHKDRDFDLALELGEMKGLMKGVIERLDRQNGSITELKKTQSKHDVLFGKIGLVVTTVVFLISLAANALIDWLKRF